MQARSRRGTWASFKKTFDPPLNLSNHQGLGVWVRGDGKGEVLNFQLRSPSHITGAVAERYVVVDFEGWRYFELVELDADRYPDFGWPYYGWYSVYRELVNYGVIESLTIWCNNLPAEDAIEVDIRPVRALPLLPGTLVNPRLTIGTAAVELPVEIASGRYVEINAAGEVQLYGPAGEPLDKIEAPGAIPALQPGDNTLEFRCSGPSTPAPARPRHHQHSRRTAALKPFGAPSDANERVGPIEQ